MLDTKIATDLARRKPLGEIVFDALCDGIISGQIEAGAWLRQEEISEELGISHTPVRQALERLAAEGLAERVPNKGVRVSRLSHENIAEIYALRMLLEPLVVRAATRDLTDSDLDRLAEIVDQMDSLTVQDQMTERRDLNRQFHMTINRACQNPLLSRLYEIVFNNTPNWMTYEGMFRQTGLAHHRLKTEMDEHKAILQALIDRDPELAEAETIKCFNQLKEDLAELFPIPIDVLEEKVQEVTPRPSTGVGLPID
ncbi:MAG: GntR family transcriptional regulator [Anaerolineales bacterium]